MTKKIRTQLSAKIGAIIRKIWDADIKSEKEGIIEIEKLLLPEDIQEVVKEDLIIYALRELFILAHRDEQKRNGLIEIKNWYLQMVDRR